MLEGVGREVSSQLSISEPTVTRHARRVRDRLRSGKLAIETYSFTEELVEAEAAGLTSDDLLRRGDTRSLCTSNRSNRTASGSVAQTMEGSIVTHPALEPRCWSA